MSTQFPVERDTAFAGMTLRDYFAAHAPDEPAAWFHYRYAERPPAEPDASAFISPKQAEPDAALVDLWREDPSEWRRARTIELAPHLEPYLAAVDKWRIEHAAWARRKQRARDITWRWAWADAVLAMRNVAIDDVEDESSVD